MKQESMEATPGFYSSAAREREPLPAGAPEKPVRTNTADTSPVSSPVLCPQSLAGKVKAAVPTPEFQPRLQE